LFVPAFTFVYFLLAFITLGFINPHVPLGMAGLVLVILGCFCSACGTVYKLDSEQMHESEHLVSVWLAEVKLREGASEQAGADG
jgi:hypothetical protein